MCLYFQVHLLVGSRLFDMMEFSQDQTGGGHYTINKVDCVCVRQSIKKSGKNSEAVPWGRIETGLRRKRWVPLLWN